MSAVAEWWQKETFIPMGPAFPPGLPPSGPPRPARRWPRRVTAVVMVLLLGAVATMGSVAWHYHQVAGHWRTLEQQQQLQVARSQSQLDLSRNSSGQLEGCIKALQKNHPGFFDALIGRTAKVPAECKSAEAYYGSNQP
jgi:predicted negative regulator of RcsB-dependent stress response